MSVSIEQTHTPTSLSPATLHCLDEWEVHKKVAKRAQRALVLQIGSPQCTRCPAVTNVLHALAATRQFTHVYVDSHDCEEDLFAELEVTQLPAYLVMRGDDVLKGQAATPEQVTQAVEQLCPPILVLDEDF
jgi:thioredoxin-like negative regulator of GroEL